MAKKSLTAAERIAQENLIRIEYQVYLVNQIYDAAIDEYVNIAGSIPRVDKLNSLKVFNFANFPGVQSQINQLVKDITLQTVNVISEGVDAAILRANLKNDALVDKVFKATNIPKKQLAKYYNHNLEAALTRETKSELSKKVYKITKQFTKTVEIGIDNAIASGKPARQAARDIRAAVKDPEFSYRRVRNAKGELEWSKAAKKFAAENPDSKGVGKYFNPQRNFERLTRTEINMAYRTADFNRDQSFDFVVGIKVNLSTNPNHCPICIALAGVYPPTYLFRSTHPQCRCYVTKILKTAAELERDNVLILQGKEPLSDSVNRIEKPHPGFFKWISENKERLEAAAKRGKSPYWIVDNFKDGDINKKLIPGAVRGGVPK